MAHIEYHPENGSSPHVVIADNLLHGSRLWFAYRTEDEAKAKHASIESEMLRLDGIIEYTKTNIKRLA